MDSLVVRRKAAATAAAPERRLVAYYGGADEDGHDRDEVLHTRERDDAILERHAYGTAEFARVDARAKYEFHVLGGNSKERRDVLTFVGLLAAPTSRRRVASYRCLGPHLSSATDEFPWCVGEPIRLFGRFSHTKVYTGRVVFVSPGSLNNAGASLPESATGHVIIDEDDNDDAGLS